MERPGDEPEQNHAFLTPDQRLNKEPLADLSPKEVASLADELSELLADPDRAKEWESVWGAPDELAHPLGQDATNDQILEHLLDKYWTKREQETGELRPSRQMSPEELKERIANIKRRALWKLAEGIGPEGIDLTDPKNNPDNFK